MSDGADRRADNPGLEAPAPLEVWYRPTRQSDDAIARRPRTARDTAMSPQTAINLVKTARQFMGWLEASDRWVPCRKWELVFRLRGKIRREDRYGRIDMLTLPEFQTLYASASPRLQCLILTALNTGQTQSELATLQRSHVDLQAGRISRPRNKTGVWGSWLLWNRTRQLLEEEMDSGPLAFLTADGQPLVWYSGKHKVDSLSLAWGRLVDRSGVRQIGFRSLRKLGAQLVRQEADLETSQLFLCHKGNSLAEVHYTNPVHAKLDVALRAIEDQVERLLDEMAKPKR